LYDKNDNSKVLKFCQKAETREFGGKSFILEEAFQPADYAWIKAKKADKMGNCVFEGAAFNFNAIMATAAKITIVEADEIVEAGEIRPEDVHLSGVHVKRLFQGFNKHRIEVLRNDEGGDIVKKLGPRDIIAMRAAKEFVAGSSCNLGVGMPTLASMYAAKDQRHVFVQSENGVLGVGGYPKKGKENSNWINAGKETIDYIPGASTFGSDTAFMQIRGGHLDMTVLGALECSQYGDIANFMIPGKMVKGMGGAMVGLRLVVLRRISLIATQDLVSNPEATKVLVVQTHTDKHGVPKIKEKCDLPLTGARCVHTIVTELACFDVDPEEGLTLRDYNPDSSIEEVKSKTAATFKIADGCGPWDI
jgi:3-oxoacid CoA-transferase